MNYSDIRQRKRQFESVTGLQVDEFDFLYEEFAVRWKKFYRYHTVEGLKRKHPLNNPAKETKTLPSIAEKLFFILVYLKNYSLQEMLAASFGFSQGNASKWVNILQPVLQDSLKGLSLLPETESARVAKKLEELGEGQCIQDATERPVNKALDRDTEEQFFSGKKKSTR